MGGIRISEILISELSRLRHGELAAAEFLTDTLLHWYGLELHSRAIVGSAKVSWVVDIRHGRYLQKGFLSDLDSKLRWVNAVQTSLNAWLESGRPTLLYSIGQSCLYDKWKSSAEEPAEASVPSYAVVVSAVVLLSLVYHYLAGNVDRGGSKAYSRSSLDFRDVYVAIVLFLGAYVWIKFREAAPTGVHRRELRDKRGGTKVVYEARLTPPMWNGEKVPRLDLGQFATPQEAHNKFLIAAFYYNRAAGLLDGWFPVPPMSGEERRFTGEEKRQWVMDQAKKVYKNFKKGVALFQDLSALVQDPSEACERQATQERAEGNVDPCGASLLYSAEHQQPAVVSQAENSGLGMAMISDNHSLECASHSLDGMHEGPALPNGNSLGSQEAFALPFSQLPPNTESGLSLTGSDQLELLQTRLGTFQQQISDLQQQIQELGAQILQLRGSEQFFLLQTRQGIFQQEISDQQQQIQDFGAQILQLPNQQCIQQQQPLQESRIENPQWPYQEQQLQVAHQGVSVFEMESMHQHNYQSFLSPPPDGGEVQEAFWEMDTLP